MEDKISIQCLGCVDYDHYNGCTANSCWKYSEGDKEIKKPSGMSNVELHADICKELNELYARKNHDYGDSFHDLYVDFGIVMSAVRIGDKFNRFKTLLKAKDVAVKDENLRDTLVDLANYSIMTVMELDREAYQNEENNTTEQECEEG